MVRKFVLGFAVLALAVASAETYRFTLFQPSVVKGTELRPGAYKLELKDNRIVIAGGGQSVEAAVKVESAEKKFSSTTLRYASSGGKYSIEEINLGGTRTRLVLDR